LSPIAVEILRSLPRIKGAKHVFTVTGEGPVCGYSKAKRQLDRLLAEQGAQLDHWTNHDLRRTVRTNLSTLPVPEGDLVRELMIGHTKSKLHKVYDQYAYLNEKRKGFELWADRLRSIVDPPSQDNVISYPHNQGAA
jgi:integrase